MVIGEENFCNLGKYASEIVPSLLEEKILKLCENLQSEDQILVHRQIALSRAAQENKNPHVSALTNKEHAERIKIEKEFFAKIFKISEELYSYNDYLFPGYFFEISVLFHKHSLPYVFPPKELEKIRQKDVIDVGGWVGDSAVMLEREFCDKTIYSFEPARKNFALMQRTLKLNHSKRVVPVNKGLGSKNEHLKISCNSGSSSILYETNAEKETIAITTLDDFVAEHGIEVGFIKVDIEGFEQHFLAGAKKTICTQKPALLISIYHSGDDYFNIKPLIESWNLGYQMRIYKGTDMALSIDTALYCYIPS